MRILGWPELVLILVILIFLFGAKRIKEVVKGLGEGVRELKESTSEPSSKLTKEENAIVDAARKIGIETEGKSTEDLVKEIAEKAAKK